jgi:predicted  nucleic acid-binding Zn-ribbon protein
VKECKGKVKQLEEDKQKLQLKLNVLESQLIKHEKEAENLKEQLKTAIRKWESERQRFQVEKEELMRVNSQLQSQKTKFQSEIRRRENELTQIRNVTFKHNNS